ncbi:hypothetical protein VP01_717g7 [Puccinia sorghi]|uniref:UDP-glucuronic acid decarboxylase 1 n=1 Tax=Puccinia sorghi TaxID=27349 RepID=A0A0L6UDB1_9BASI|nr:hypothetical protein VP01_717g7 [Puccinia sorghi]
MFPTTQPTTPFRNSPSIDALYPGYHQPREAVEQELEVVGEKKDKTDVPLELLRSVILKCSDTTSNMLKYSDTTLNSYKEITASWYAPTIAYAPTQVFPPVRHLPGHDRKRILVTGGAGFVDRLMFMGGSKTAVAHWIGHPNFELIRHDVVDPFMIECDQIYHLACPASPVAYQYNSIKTMKTNFMGTMNMLGLAKRTKARFLLSSTSEVYGSPEQHPQKGKRVAEALTYGYARENGVSVRVARIFNTYGPRMSPSDGRLVSNFIMAAIRGQPLEIYGDGNQTRSLMYVLDLVEGLIRLMNSEHPSVAESPVNLGSDDEQPVRVWAQLVIDIVQQLSLKTPTVSSHIIHKPPLPDDPPRRRPDTSKARDSLAWQPQWSAQDGLKDTAKFFFHLVHSGYSS